MIPAGSVEWQPERAAAVADLYDACVRQLDAELGEVFAAMKDLGLWERTIVVFTADHGEELLERGQVGHASTNLQGTLHQEILGIPLLLRLPGIPGGRVIEEFAQPVDVMPTVFAALGLPPWPYFQGRSLLPLLRGEPAPPADHAFSESTDCGWQCPSDRRKTARLKAVRDRRFKLMVRVTPTGERSEALFDLAADPLETRDALREHPLEARRLAAALADHERNNLEKARALVATVLDGHRRDLEPLPPAARAERLAEVCDELAMLRYIYEVESPSLWATRPGRELWREKAGAIRRLLGSGASRYWACAALSEE
jgi:arylsulfatase A-like enzyme